MLLWKLPVGVSHDQHTLFQSLFSWMLLWKQEKKQRLYKTKCFNPCSLGCCSERLFPGLLLTKRGWFQSLFSWMLLWKRRMSSVSVVWVNGVSILVLLDVALKASHRALMPSRYLVSILVLLDVALKGRWKDPTVPLLHGVSILVLLDVALKEPYLELLKLIYPEFQSLFSWMLLWKIVPNLPALTNDGFQSLFSWMLLWKSVFDTGIPDSVNWFQSLFSWMLLWKYLFKSGILWCVLFQSLFSWMLLWKTAEELMYNILDTMFQSLFSWMLLWKTVLSSAISSQSACFNPCSLGCCSERRLRMTTSVLYGSFNPCSLGCCSER